MSDRPQLPRVGGLGARLRAIFSGPGRADPEAWAAAEEALIAGDVGPLLAADLVEQARAAGRPGEDPRDVLATLIRERLVEIGAQPFEIGPPPAVILLVGVNGSGKTTTAVKLGARLAVEGEGVLLAAADTFRAAAVEQLQQLADRARLPVVSQRPGADPGAVAFDALAAAEARGAQVVIIDTAGRLHAKVQLMAELAKIRRVIERRLPDQPRHVLLVLDATTGQNGLAQAEAFTAEAGVTGLVVTKLDGTARGGVALAIAHRLGLPIAFVGVGEGLDQLLPFDAAAYAEWLVAT